MISRLILSPSEDVTQVTSNKLDLRFYLSFRIANLKTLVWYLNRNYYISMNNKKRSKSIVLLNNVKQVRKQAYEIILKCFQGNFLVTASQKSHATLQLTHRSQKHRRNLCNKKNSVAILCSTSKNWRPLYFISCHCSLSILPENIRKSHKMIKHTQTIRWQFANGIEKDQ